MEELLQLNVWMCRVSGVVAQSFVLAVTWGCSAPPSGANSALVQQLQPKVSPERVEAFRRAGVWIATNVEATDVKAGPSGPGSFPFLATVTCDYVDKPLRGHSLKFACDAGGGDIVKVKIGETNGEVYGEVAATRLLRALGFGADAMYPVRVICRGCPSRFGGLPSGQHMFDPAVVERSMAGAVFDGDPGWSWPEIDLVDEGIGGAPRAHRDGLKLLAVFLQHTDNKPEQQRLLCLDEPISERAQGCRRPFLMIDDVGLTFGRANFLNDNALGGANFQAWSEAAIWKDPQDCIGSLSRSFTGTLSNPRISEEGRQFLAGLLLRLSQQQIRDLFEVSRFDLGPASVRDSVAGASIDDWVRVFNQKRDAIVSHRCH